MSGKARRWGEFSPNPWLPDVALGRKWTCKQDIIMNVPRRRECSQYRVYTHSVGYQMICLGLVSSPLAFGLGRSSPTRWCDRMCDWQNYLQWAVGAALSCFWNFVWHIYLLWDLQGRYVLRCPYFCGQIYRRLLAAYYEYGSRIKI